MGWIEFVFNSENNTKQCLNTIVDALAFLKAHLLVRSKTQVNATIYEQLRGITRRIKTYRYGFKIIRQHYDKILILTPNLARFVHGSI
jgi:predicted transcriptional regulator